VLVDPTNDALIRSAILERRLVRFLLDGLERVAEPHDYGLRDGQPYLLAYQIRGRTRSAATLPAWRWVKVAKIENLTLLPETFPGGRGGSHSRHSKWDEVFMRVEGP
jgi:hypothetical protein